MAKYSEMENLINSTSWNARKSAYYMATRCHRYLQGQFFKICFYFIELLAKHYEEGLYDARNEYACKRSKTIIDLLTKYDKEYCPMDFSDLQGKELDD